MEEFDNGLIIVNNIAKKMNKFLPEIETRRNFLEELIELIDYDLAVFEICKLSNEKIKLVEPVMKSKFDSVFERRFLFDYDTKFVGMSYSRWVHNEKRTIFLRDSDLIVDEIRKETRYYKEYIKPFGFEHVLNCEYANNGFNIASLTLYRSAENGDFKDSDIYYMELLAPCLIHALSQTIIVEPSFKNNHFLDKFSLTKREKEIINLVYEGKSNRETAEVLFISENTVKKHLSNIFQKMNMSNRKKMISYLHIERYRDY
jgi:DNA-binding CsgD family transcriptional regulator